ncbi:hypothetical protein PVAP13_8KG268200 [Panicum virgatum]|nr:hypothetical protein PVAP13_8KG268200 [Panicum virgatum]KAG2563182.1 hypothetical protein PVAP13_8KG268200 [Panicum virgatum]
MVTSFGSKLSSDGTPSTTSTFRQSKILIFCNLESPLILLSFGQSNTSGSTTEGKQFSTAASCLYHGVHFHKTKNEELQDHYETMFSLHETIINA